MSADEVKVKLEEQKRLEDLAKKDGRQLKLMVAERVATVDLHEDLQAARNTADLMYARENPTLDEKTLVEMYGEQNGKALFEAKGVEARMKVLAIAVESFDGGSQDLFDLKSVVDPNRAEASGKDKDEKLKWCAAARVSLLEMGIKALDEDNFDRAGFAFKRSGTVFGRFGTTEGEAVPEWANAAILEAIKVDEKMAKPDFVSGLAGFELPGAFNAESARFPDKQASANIEEMKELVIRAREEKQKNEQKEESAAERAEWDKKLEQGKDQLIEKAEEKADDVVERLSQNSYAEVDKADWGTSYLGELQGKELLKNMDEYVALLGKAMAGENDTVEMIDRVASSDWSHDAGGHNRRSFEEKMKLEKGDSYDWMSDWKMQLQEQLKIQAQGHLIAVLKYAVRENNPELRKKAFMALGQGDMVGIFYDNTDKLLAKRLREGVDSFENMATTPGKNIDKVFPGEMQEADERMKSVLVERQKLREEKEVEEERKKTEEDTGKVKERIEAENARIREILKKVTEDGDVDKFLGFLTRMDTLNWEKGISQFEMSMNKFEGDSKVFFENLMAELKKLSTNEEFVKRSEVVDEGEKRILFFFGGRERKSQVSIEVKTEKVKEMMTDLMDNKMAEGGLNLNQLARHEALRVLARRNPVVKYPEVTGDFPK